MPTKKDPASQISVSVATFEPDEPRAKAAHHATDAPGPARAAVMLLRLLRAAQPISRAELARRVGVNRSTVTDTFKPLIAAGVVREEAVSVPAPGSGRGLGRPPSALTFSDEHGFFVGVSVGVRRRYDVAVADALRFDHEGGPGTPETSVPVVVENDATAAALYELRLRLGRAESERLDDFVLVRSGTGLGVGLVLGGEVFRGDALGEGFAGEFGHMTIVAGGKQCRCGNRGCWEMYASASAASSLYTGDRVQLGGQTAPRFVEIVARADGGELRAQRTLERLGEYLGIGIANVITGLGVSRVIVSGRLVYGWKFMREPVRGAVAQSMAGRLSGWSVEPGEATGAGLGGALEVAAEGFLTAGLV
ncbi:MAG: ROK family transcriptional regulator [Acidobacteria bacterium]|nr:ROK family transcriptional regulator [Acidobacteriota bacterium]